MPDPNQTDKPPALHQREGEPTEKSDLTPIRAHYLKKALVQLQFARELDLISTEGPPNVSTLSYLGPPFTSPPKDAPPLDLPFLRYIFRQFVLTFPFMAAAPKDFYSLKLQPFVGAVLARNITQGSVLDDAESEQASRKRLLAKVERNLSLFVNAATKLVEPEEVVRLSQADLDRLEVLSRKRQRRLAKDRDSFEVNIVSVRTVVDKGRMRSRAHEEFIIRTKRSRYPDVYVSRRYGDFRTLAAELAKMHPQEEIRLPPAKDKTYSSAPPMTPTTSQPPPSRQATSSTFNDYNLNSPTGLSSENFPAPSRLTREKNRLTLRSYLNSLLSSSTIASSPVLRSFLLSGPTTLSPEELEDARRREEADRVREEGRKKFAKEIAGRVDGLREAVKSVKGDIMGKDGLTRIFATIKVTPDIRDLPSNYHAVVEWARISLASTVFQMFVASDDASETFSGLKRIHGLMPYFMMKTALKITNPVAMIRSMLDLFLAQPFGGRSLLQRMFTSSLTEEVKVLEEEIEAVKEKVDDPIMCEKVRQFVYAPREIQSMFKDDAASEQMHVLTIVLRSAENPVLSRAQMHRLARAHKAHIIYTKYRESLADSDDDDGPQDDDAWLLEDLKVLANLYSKLKDREQLIELIFETVEQVDGLSQDDPHLTVQAFVNLIIRHEQSFYHFVHKVHAKGEGLFDNLMRWVELFLTAVRDGLGEPISLEYLLPHKGQERADIFAEVDKIAQYHYKLKVLYEDKLRRRFGRAQSNEADAEDEATQAMVNGVIGEISFGELVQGDAVDLAAEETDEADTTSEEEYSSSEYETGSESDNGSDEFRTDKIKSKHPPSLPTSPLSPSYSSSATSQSLAHSHDRQPRNHIQTSPRKHAQHASTTGSSSNISYPPEPKRKRSLSLHRAKSLTFSLGKRNQDVPPVPLIPAIPPVSPVSTNPKIIPPPPSRPLPPSPYSDDSPPPVPSKDSPSEQYRAMNSTTPNASPHNVSLKAKRKKVSQGLKPPELQHIPQLLPVFTEMMKPLLLRKSQVE
ncbi:PX domain-containing protein [Psilocybe cubensis]|uniref:PX domain-containing protein n=1 Tax=Psilocybe cubensis TaxID=181762 RepID=A0ACB8H4P3_PSICU|nr:PX domain-containing protein [Psilocybe cubensis]KAH9482684.1 PX domain-containing protein [Psilocybe cubensis]